MGHGARLTYTARAEHSIIAPAVVSTVKPSPTCTEPLDHLGFRLVFRLPPAGSRMTHLEDKA